MSNNDIIKRIPDSEHYLWWAVLVPRFLLICLELGGKYIRDEHKSINITGKSVFNI